ncbi:hypothetical protein J4G37_32385 [Microvirga sp. 3-52]|nr:hypothetical protein [Microvirga sp. 3-52]
MSDGVTNELISHFAGLLRLIEPPVPANRDIYDGDALASRGADYAIHLTPDLKPALDLEETASKAFKASLPLSSLSPLAKMPLSGGTQVDHPAAVSSKVSFAGPDPVAVPTVLPTSVDAVPTASPPYAIAYEDGGNDKLVNIVQTNIMDDDDALVTASADGLSEIHDINVPQVLSGLLKEAREAGPADLIGGQRSATDWQEAVAQRDADLKDAGGGEVEAGIHVNGNLVATKPDLTASAPKPPENGGAGTQVLETGGNKTINQAVIGDLNDAPGTLIVLGDHFETNAIVQANVYTDRDQVMPGGSHSAATQTGDNLALNIAALIEKTVDGPRGDGIGPKGLKVDVTIADGDLFDVKVLTQRNWISDNDEAVQTATDGYSGVYVGGNQQANAARLLDTGTYDVVIVLGDYHDFNLITQTNILIDDDIFGSAAGGGTEGDNAHGGHNRLVNDAAIEQHGAQSFQDIPDEIDALIKTLGQRGQASLEDWSGFAGSASGHLSVLVVRGDYWDINIISQTNVIVDADVALQNLAGAGEQWLSTGGNEATNSATILNAGGLIDQYVGGSHYSDAILVQAEYVDAAATVVNHDTLALISEAVAFTGLLDDSEFDDDHSPGPSWAPPDDTFGCVLT